MLSTEYVWLVAGFAFGMAAVAAFLCVRAVKYANEACDFAQQALDFTQTKNARSVSLAKLTDLEAQMTELVDSYHSLLSSHKKLRSRIGMRELRERRANGADHADETYEAKKNRLREQAKSKGYLR